MGEYDQATAESRRLTADSYRVSTADLPIVMNRSFAQRLADIWLMDTWARRERAEFSLPPSHIAIDPYDQVQLQLETQSIDVELTFVQDRYERQAQATAIEPSVNEAPLPLLGAVTLPTSPVYGPPIVEFMDLPALPGRPDQHAPYIAAYTNPWPGTLNVYQSPETTGYTLNETVRAPAIMGVTDWDFYSGPTSRWDRGNVLRVKLGGGLLESQSELAVLNGANAAAIQNEDGEWEVLQFRNAVLAWEGVYDLSLFLRGQLGTEKAMRHPLGAGAPFVLLNGAITQLDLSRDQRGVDLNWLIGPAGYPFTDISFRADIFGYDGVGLRPYSPVHVKAHKTATNDIVISWIRRTRIDGDSWAQVDVPLGEEFEAYEIDVMSGSTVKRTLSASSPTVTYSAAEQIADFGAHQSNITLRVVQLSNIFGRGTYREATLNV